MRNTVTVNVLRALLTNNHMGARCHPDPSDGRVDGCSGNFITTWSSEKASTGFLPAFHNDHGLFGFGSKQTGTASR